MFNFSERQVKAAGNHSCYGLDVYHQGRKLQGRPLWLRPAFHMSEHDKRICSLCRAKARVTGLNFQI